MFRLTPLYRGGPNEAASWLHKLTGLGLFLFLAFHIVDTAALAYSANLYNKIIGLYRLPFFKMGEIVLIGCVLFHAFNGLRLILLDIFINLVKHHRALIWVEAFLVLAIWIPTTLTMIFRHG